MKDALGHGSNGRSGSGGPPKPIPGHPYHKKSDTELRYIVKDASEAERATRGMSSYNPASGQREDTAGKYSDQINDASSVLGYRTRGGQRDYEPDAVARAALASGSPKSAPVPTHDGFVGRHGYNPESVSKAIANNRTGKIGAREGSAIHRLLRGRG